MDLFFRSSKPFEGKQETVANFKGTDYHKPSWILFENIISGQIGVMLNNFFSLHWIILCKNFHIQWELMLFSLIRKTVCTSTSSLLQILLSNFKLRTLEILGPRERCCPGTQEVINMSSQIHKNTYTQKCIQPLGLWNLSQLDLLVNAWLSGCAFSFWKVHMKIT